MFLLLAIDLEVLMNSALSLAPMLSGLISVLLFFNRISFGYETFKLNEHPNSLLKVIKTNF